MPRYFYICSITIDADNMESADEQFYKQIGDMDVSVSEVEVQGE
jgi:hypothetical protein